MASNVPSSCRSSLDLYRKRTAPPRRYGSMAHLMRRSRLVSRQDPMPLRYGSMVDVMHRTGPVRDAPAPAPRVVVPAPDEDIVCDACGSGDHGDQLLLCDRCDLGCHTFCLQPTIAKVPNGSWFCPRCVPPVKPIENFPVEQSKIIDFSRIQNFDQDGEPAKSLSENIPYEMEILGNTPAPAPPVVVTAPEDIICDACSSGNHGDQLLLCDRCDRGCHTFCLRPIIDKVPNGSWYCPRCAPPVKPIESFPVELSKIIDFFRIQNFHQNGEPTNCRLSHGTSGQRKPHLLTHKKSRRRILPFVPADDITRRLKQMASLATALTSSKAEFYNELTYMPNMAPRSSNQAKSEEGGIQVLNKEDKETVELCRAMQQRGQCPPLLVVFDPIQGFTLQADANIKDMTFIAEFAGDVDYFEKRKNDYSNCMMTLLWTEDASRRLVICQDKRANISRFISGINNHTPNAKKKQNAKCVRYDIDGESRVLLVVCRDINRGEKLYCDYNGKERAYPTHDFV